VRPGGADTCDAHDTFAVRNHTSGRSTVMKQEQPPPQLFGRWLHSFEEGREQAVYRPVGYPFPRARGRAGLEFRPDGTVVEWRIGPGDAGLPVEGQWVLDVHRVLRLTVPGAAGTREVDMGTVEDGVLRVRGDPTP
jgi:hypothetical protein